MDELDLFRDFRGGVAPPSPDAERRASARLAHTFERAQRTRFRPHAIRVRPGRLTLAVAALAVAAAATLFVSSPWRTSPGFLERAEAALTIPPGTILHIRWETQTTSREFGCTVNPGPSEVWADQTPPLRYRLVAPRLEDYPATGGRDLACAVGTPTEVGGTLRPRQTLRFLPPDTLMEDASAFAPWDVAVSLREALQSGTAVAEGKVTLDGRVVERIRMNPRCPIEPCPSEPGQAEPSYAYVDPETFYPVRLDLPGTYGSPDGHDLHVVDSYRILTYEYLPRTAANIALTDIRAQHPDATVAGR